MKSNAFEELVQILQEVDFTLGTTLATSSTVSVESFTCIELEILTEKQIDFAINYHGFHLNNNKKMNILLCSSSPNTDMHEDPSTNLDHNCLKYI